MVTLGRSPQLGAPSLNVSLFESRDMPAKYHDELGLD